MSDSRSIRAWIVQGGVLLLCVSLAAVCCAWWGRASGLSHAWQAAAVAGGVNLLAGWAGLFVVAWGTARWPAHGALLGTFVRMAIPLPVGVALQQAGGALAESRVFGMLLACYLVMLTTETLLLVRTLPRGAAVAGASNGGVS